MIYFNTTTTFKENKKMKELRKKLIKKLNIEEGMFIRKCVYDALNIQELTIKK
jgi:hypothetical protein